MSDVSGKGKINDEKFEVTGTISNDSLSLICLGGGREIKFDGSL